MSGEETLTQPALTLEGFGRLPASEFRLRDDGAVESRYVVEGGDFPGFDGHWRAMGEFERREHLRLGGRIAEWLRAIGKGGDGS